MTVRRALFEILFSEAAENVSHVDKWEKKMCVEIIAGITRALRYVSSTLSVFCSCALFVRDIQA